MTVDSSVLVALSMGYRPKKESAKNVEPAIINTTIVALLIHQNLPTAAFYSTRHLCHSCQPGSLLPQQLKACFCLPVLFAY